MIKSAALALDRSGFETQGELSGPEGLRAAEAFAPDVILLDVMMPGMDGWEVLKKLRENETTRKVPVIMFTAKEYSNGKALAESQGASDYLPKPFELDELVAVLEKYSP
jgi:DNA-binding response OmpR family regulator